VAGSCECGDELAGPVEMGELGIVNFSKRTLFHYVSLQYCGVPPKKLE
jgi:hypothetical protein